MFWGVCLYRLKSEVGCSSRIAASFNYASSVATGSPCLRCLNIKYKIRLRRRRRYKFLITYWFGVHQFRQSLWYWIQISINCYLSWFYSCFSFLDVAFLPNHCYFVNFLSCFNLLYFFASILTVFIVFGALFRRYKYWCMALYTTQCGLWKRLQNRLIDHSW